MFDQEKLIQNLINIGWYATDHFLTNEHCDHLIGEIKNLNLKEAQVGKGIQKSANSTIRNDSIYWLDKNNQSSAQDAYLSQMETLMAFFNRELYLGLKQVEAHFARYDKNGFYKKHLDQFIGNSDRRVSVVTYLNAPTEGGELRIYNRENPEFIDCDYVPKKGSMVCFLSDQIYHEVLTTKAERYSIAGWFRTNIL